MGNCASHISMWNGGKGSNRCWRRHQMLFDNQRRRMLHSPPTMALKCRRQMRAGLYAQKEGRFMKRFARIGLLVGLATLGAAGCARPGEWGYSPAYTANERNQMIAR